MSSPESAPSTPPVEKTKLHLVEDLPEETDSPDQNDTIENETPPRLELSREDKRDHDAIQAFIDMRDKLWAKGRGFSLDESVYKASLVYDSIVGTPLTHWGPEPLLPEPEEQPKDPNPANTSGNLVMGSMLPEVETDITKNGKYTKIFDEAKEQAIEDVRERYVGEGRDRDAMAKKKKEIQLIKLSFEGHKIQTSLDVMDDEEYKDSEGKIQKKNTKNHALRLKEQLDYYNPAIEASYGKRMAALKAGKSLTEADKEGAVEYERVMTKLGIVEGTIKLPEPKLSHEDLVESLAIKDFNSERDMYIPPSRQHGIYERGLALHRATSKYKERKHISGEHGEHGEHGEPSPTSPSTQEKEQKFKKIRSFAKNVFSAMKSFGKNDSRLEDPVKNGLFRYNSQGALIRPAASSEKFRTAAADTKTSGELGNQDIGKTGNYLSYGAGPNLGGKGSSNEQAGISERATSIVKSYKARDNALAEGKTLEEAQKIGSEVYNEQEKISAAQLAENKEKLLLKKESRERTGKWLRKVGLSALLIKKVVTEKEFISLATGAGVNLSKDTLREISDGFRRRKANAESRKIERKQNKSKRREIVKRANNVADLEQKERIDEMKKALRDYIAGQRT